MPRGIIVRLHGGRRGARVALTIHEALQMSPPLAGKVALVTGGARGIGRACARKLAAAGCDVAVNYYNSHDEAEALCAELSGLGRKAIALQGSAGDPASVPTSPRCRGATATTCSTPPRTGS